MRILIINKFAQVTGGADAYCLDLAAAMRARGHELAFLTTSDPRNDEKVGAFVPPTVTRDDRLTLNVRQQLHAASSAFWNQTAYEAMRRLISAFQPDVVSAHKLYPQLSVSPLIAARKAGLPVVQTVHDYEFVSASAIDHTGRAIDRDEVTLRFRVFNSSLFAVKRRVHRGSVTRWIAVSEFVATTLRSSGIDALVVPNPAPRPVRKALPFSERQGLVFAGRLAPEKGVADVLRLAELLPEIEINVAGDGPAAPLVEDAARRSPNLRYVGRIDRSATNKLFSRALAVIVPSLWQEPGSLVTLEAMASGTPLVVYSVGGIAEYVAKARAGIVVQKRPEALAAACASLVTDAEAWTRFSVAGVSAAAGPHSAETHCGILEQVFADAVAT